MSALPSAAPQATERPRTRIGRIPNLGDREYVYRCDDALSNRYLTFLPAQLANHSRQEPAKRTRAGRARESRW